ncbi:RSPH1 family protein [Megaselia abdita]
MSEEDESDFEFEEEQEEEDPIGKYLGQRNHLKERHGKGWAILPNHDQYDGDYKHGIRHGQGLYVFRNGARYLGRYRCGKRYGQGIFYYPDGSVYEGQWRKNLKHGFGTYTYPNGDVYRGNWHKNLRHGVGVYNYKHVCATFKGTWKQGVRVGPVEIHYPKHKYHGYWDWYLPQGPGVFTFDCKYMLNGYYKSDEVAKLTSGLGEEGEYENYLEGEYENEHEEINPRLKFLLIPPSIWNSQYMQYYDFSKLPQQPIPLAISDSEDSPCDLSESEKAESHYSIHEENEEEGELEKFPTPEESCDMDLNKEQPLTKPPEKPDDDKDALIFIC